MTIAAFDHLPDSEKRELLQMCCGSSSWVNKMLGVFPVNDLIDLFEYADEKWAECKKEDWLEAFEFQPVLGDISSAKEKFGLKGGWLVDEQDVISDASPGQLKILSQQNDDYLQKFGYTFIINTSGKSAGEILFHLEQRIKNDPLEEIKIGAAEHIRVTKNRLQKLFS